MVKRLLQLPPKEDSQTFAADDQAMRSEGGGGSETDGRCNSSELAEVADNGAGVAAFPVVAITKDTPSDELLKLARLSKFAALFQEQG
eukprot:CAMPEP_0171840938 /NCGR_PEP_ID=MMETSP0992-20121227/14271_1 /TAXON_ID=483369 /ORGANISM="non described non described, Strain CCMP2098" /LENGTH=87 /DNA_ID=CAMNT_0012457837 /DNA_START=292 /DNA_END=551 /DNA_ORIENTATION=+